MHSLPYLPPPDWELDILHVDEALLIVNKPAGLLSVPGRGPGKEDCLVTRVHAVYPDALIVHRLDMETSGVMVLARNPEAHRQLSIGFQERQVDKTYVAIVDGRPEAPAGRIDLPLIADWPNRPRQKVDHDLGKPSLTHWRLLACDAVMDVSRVALIPETGRSHQLRVHLMSIGHPIIGDTLYAPPSAQAKASRLMLHADFLAFIHPRHGERMDFSCPPPF